MGVFDNAKKVPTGVCGLDSLFYDGLQFLIFLMRLIKLKNLIESWNCLEKCIEKEWKPVYD